MNDSIKIKITGLIISAGMSKRMGEFKPLMSYSGETFIHNIVSRLDHVCQSIIIVTGYNSEQLQSETLSVLTRQGKNTLVKKIRFIKNKEYKKGMFTSLQKGLKEIISSNMSEWAIYHFIDQPGLPDDFYTGFTEQIEDAHNWIQPSFKKRKGHPILLRDDLFEVILKSDANSSLRDVSRKPVFKKKFWECGFEYIFQDIDTQEDYISYTKR